MASRAPHRKQHFAPRASYLTANRPGTTFPLPLPTRENKKNFPCVRFAFMGLNGAGFHGGRSTGSRAGGGRTSRRWGTARAHLRRAWRG